MHQQNRNMDVPYLEMVFRDDSNGYRIEDEERKLDTHATYVVISDQGRLLEFSWNKTTQCPDIRGDARYLS